MGLCGKKKNKKVNNKENRSVFQIFSIQIQIEKQIHPACSLVFSNKNHVILCKSIALCTLARRSRRRWRRKQRVRAKGGRRLPAPTTETNTAIWLARLLLKTPPTRWRPIGRTAAVSHKLFCTPAPHHSLFYSFSELLIDLFPDFWLVVSCSDSPCGQ